MSGKVFIDTNLWVYLHAGESKGDVIRLLVDQHFQDVTISAQVLGELYHVLTRKKLMDTSSAQGAVVNLRQTFTVIAIQPDDSLKAIEVSIRYGYSYWDSLIIVSALTSNCAFLYSEDMHHGQVIDNRLKIRNPFVTSES